MSYNFLQSNTKRYSSTAIPGINSNQDSTPSLRQLENFSLENFQAPHRRWVQDMNPCVFSLEESIVINYQQICVPPWKEKKVSRKFICRSLELAPLSTPIVFFSFHEWRYKIWLEVAINPTLKRIHTCCSTTTIGRWGGNFSIENFLGSRSTTGWWCNCSWILFRVVSKLETNHTNC
jgi:hypothetical protein